MSCKNTAVSVARALGVQVGEESLEQEAGGASHLLPKLGESQGRALKRGAPGQNGLWKDGVEGVPKECCRFL